MSNIITFEHPIAIRISLDVQWNDFKIFFALSCIACIVSQIFNTRKFSQESYGIPGNFLIFQAPQPQFLTINQQLKSKKHLFHLPGPQHLRQIQSVLPLVAPYYLKEGEERKDQITRKKEGRNHPQSQFQKIQILHNVRKKHPPAELFYIVTEKHQLKLVLPNDMAEYISYNFNVFIREKDMMRLCFRTQFPSICNVPKNWTTDSLKSLEKV